MVSGASLAPLSHMFQRPAELVPSAVDVGLYGSQREVERRRDLLIGSALDVPQHDARSVLGPKTADRALDRRAQFARFELVEGGFLLAHDVERRRLDRVGCLGVR